MNKNKIFTIVIAVIVLSMVFFNFNKTNKMPKNVDHAKVLIGNFVVEAEFVATPESRERGLSGRVKLEENEGMLFVFDKPDLYRFWMKDMNFPIDIIWISENMEIVDITENAQPKSFPKTFFPKKPARFVLEVNAGWKEKHEVKIGAGVKVSR